jgi:hypothetical protein
VKDSATGSSHAWTAGLMVLSYNGDRAATVSFANFSVAQVQP